MTDLLLTPDVVPVRAVTHWRGAKSRAEVRNILGYVPAGVRLLDLFGGSGTISLSAAHAAERWYNDLDPVVENNHPNDPR